MKKRLLTMLATICLLGCLSVPTFAAEENMCDELYHFALDNSMGPCAIATDGNYPTSVVYFHTALYIDTIASINQYATGIEEYQIPETVFENAAKQFFDKVDVNALRNYDGNYNAANRTYTVYDYAFGGGEGYTIAGYVKSGNNYEIWLMYSCFAEWDESSIPAGYVEYIDYIKCYDSESNTYFVEKVNDGYCSAWIKMTATYNGSVMKFCKTETATGLPNVSGLVKQGDYRTTTNNNANNTTNNNISNSTTSNSNTTTNNSTTNKNTNANSNTATSTTPENSDNENTQVTEKVFATTENISIKAMENVFPTDTIVLVEEIKDKDKVASITEYLKDSATNFVAYDITATSNGVSVQPNGTVKATFQVPDDFVVDKLQVLFVSEDGEIEVMTSTIDKSAKTITAELSHFSTYVVSETQETDNLEIDTENEQSENSKTSSDTEKKKSVIWIIISIIVALVGVGVTVWYFVFCKKKKLN